jgi:tetratricopeptide (TPR) repeat protein
MKKSGLSLLFCFLLINTGYASISNGESVRIFNEGNSEYQKANYLSAEKLYRSILDSGMDNGILYYNLGNTCFKQKHLGEAIFYWEKARQLLPTDQEIQDNLELARLMLVDRIEAPQSPLPIQFLARMSGILTITQDQRLAIILFILLNILFYIYLRIKNPRTAFRVFMSCMVIGFLFIIFACSLTWKIYNREYHKEGIVIEQKVDVRSGPGQENITVFTIHEGIKVRIHESNNGWQQISLPNGWSGWMPQKDLRIL